MLTPDKIQRQIVDGIRQFVERKVIPVARELEHRDEYPHEIVDEMKEMGLFGCNVPEEYGGLGLSYTTFAMIIEELSRGWMSIVGPIGTHSVICDIINRFGTEEQKREYLPGLASGARRGGLALSEADAGTDVQRISTVATRVEGGYLINGSKMWITNGRYGDTFVLAAKDRRQSRSAAQRRLRIHHREERERRRGVQSRPRHRQARLSRRRDLRTIFRQPLRPGEEPDRRARK